MRILITGGTGFIGTTLCQKLLDADHQLLVLTRQAKTQSRQGNEQIGFIDTLENLDSTQHFDAIINLAGEPIAAQRWSSRRKQVLLDSRLKTTQALLDFIQRAEIKPECMINASAVGFYGDQGDKLVTESTPAHEDFGHQLCAQWETLAHQVEPLAVRLCIVRIGLVVGANGGFLQRMLLPFKLGLGGPIGSGQQWMSWIHREDLIQLMLWLLENKSCNGVYNGTAPEPVTSREFATTLGNCLHRPAFMPMPSPMLRLALGEMSELLLGGQRASPVRALEQGFTFKFTQLRDALQDVI